MIKSFCEILNEIGMLLVYEVMCDLLLELVEIEILIVLMWVLKIVGKKFILVLILCVGVGFFDGMLVLMLLVCIVYIGFYWDFEML